MEFAKMFNSEKLGQLCAILQTSDDEGAPEIHSLL